MLTLRTMAGDGLKDDVNDVNDTTFFKRSLLMFCMCVALYDGNHHWIDH